jgi:PhoH-like ATPase
LKKKYILDTSVLIDNPECIKLLRNGEENEIYIPKIVIEEIDNLKHKDNKKYLALRVIDALEKYKKYYQILNTEKYPEVSNDNKILEEIKKLPNIDQYTFITNDRLFKIKSEKEYIKTEDFKTSNPFKTETEKYTGFIDLYDDDGKKEN